MRSPEKRQARRIAVIGAGIVGASVAFRPARSREARVSIVERSRPGSGTTSATFAWANANEKTPREYFEINLAGLEEHYRLCDAGSNGCDPGATLPNGEEPSPSTSTWSRA